MKTTILLALAAPAIAGVAAPREPSAEEECGELGVMVVPPGEDPTKYRRCAGHPTQLLKPDPETWTEADGPRRHYDVSEPVETIIIEYEPREDGLETLYPELLRKKYGGPDGDGWYPPHGVRFVFKEVRPGEERGSPKEEASRGAKESADDSDAATTVPEVLELRR